MRNQRGLTIIELLVVLIIIGILLGIAMISGRMWLDKYRTEAQMKEMFVDLMNARVSAMQKNRLHFVTFGPSAAVATRYTIYEDTNPMPDGDGTLQTASDRTVVDKNINPAYAVQTQSTQITFDSRGLVSAGLVGTQATVRANDSFGAAYNCIVISLTRIRMGAWNGSSCVVQ